MTNEYGNMELRYRAFAAVYGSVGVLGLPLNAVSLWVLLRHHGLKSSCTVFMFHLALSDLLLVISLPTRVYFYATGTWPFSVHVCCTATMLFRNNIRSSAFFITFIGLDRLLAVVFPLRSRHLRSTSNAWKACISVWLLILGTNIPEGIYFVHRRKAYNVTTCFEPIDRPEPIHQPNRIVPYLQSTIFLTLLVVNVVSTAIVSWTLRRSLSDAARVNNKMNAMLIFVMNLLVFVICFLPLSILLLGSDREASMIGVCVASVNCCLDPLLYYFSLDGFWKKKEAPESRESR